MQVAKFLVCLLVLVTVGCAIAEETTSRNSERSAQERPAPAPSASPPSRPPSPPPAPRPAPPAAPVTTTYRTTSTTSAPLVKSDCDIAHGAARASVDSLWDAAGRYTLAVQDFRYSNDPFYLGLAQEEHSAVKAIAPIALEMVKAMLTKCGDPSKPPSPRELTVIGSFEIQIDDWKRKMDECRRELAPLGFRC